MKVTLQLRVDGDWRCIFCDVDFPAVPRVGETIEIADGWCSETVKRVDWSFNGDVSVEFVSRMSKEEAEELIKCGYHYP